MRPITQYSSLLLFIPWLSYISSTCDAALVTQWATQTCHTYTVVGKAQVCCNGKCADVTNLNSPGLCVNWRNAISDPETVPTCPGTQAWVLTASTSITTGGTCAPNCQWESQQYTYECCECPSGLVSDFAFYELGYSTNPYRYEFCYGCSGGDETLSFDNMTGVYSCSSVSQTSSQAPNPTASQPPAMQALCKIAPELEGTFTALGNLDSWFGAVCPTAKKLPAIIQVITDLVDLFNAITNPTSGVSGTEFTAASDVISTIKSFLLTAVFVGGGISLGGITAAMGTEWATACAIVSVAGIEFAAAKKALQAFQYLKCPPISPHAQSKRFLNLDTSAFGSFETYRDYSRRDVAYNPCADFLSYFPTDYMTAALADAGCNQIKLYDASMVEDATIALAIADMQQFCGTYQSSGNSTMTMAWQNVLAAVEAAVPYCEVVRTTSSSAPFSSLATGTSSFFSSVTTPPTSVSPSTSTSMATGTSSLTSLASASSSSTTAAPLNQTSSSSLTTVESRSSSSAFIEPQSSTSMSSAPLSVTASARRLTDMGSTTTTTSPSSISSVSPNGPHDCPTTTIITSVSTKSCSTTTLTDLVRVADTSVIPTSTPSSKPPISTSNISPTKAARSSSDTSPLPSSGAGSQSSELSDPYTSENGISTAAAQLQPSSITPASNSVSPALASSPPSSLNGQPSYVASSPATRIISILGIQLAFMLAFMGLVL